MNHAPPSSARRTPGLLARLARDSGGNTLALIAASIAPIMAMVGGGVDMGRAYIAQSRLQQACDAGVLAARKRLGSEAAVTGQIPEFTAQIGQRFFNVNFRDGAYGSRDRRFMMTLESDYAISGAASVTVPTTIMRIFGFNELPLEVTCEAQINFANSDVMMVLDVTGSMSQTNPGDDAPRIEILKATVRDFHAQLQASAQAGTRLRYGFVPYSTNVNVGGLLKDEWMVDKWKYQSRELDGYDVGDVLSGLTTHTRTSNATYISGETVRREHSTYDATIDASGVYRCPSRPANTVVTSETSSTATELVTTPLPGVRTTTTYVRTRNGLAYSVSLRDRKCVVIETSYRDYKDTYKRITEPALTSGDAQWKYKQLEFDVSNWRAESNGCIEERKTYEIEDYYDVDLNKALDLDIDRIPTPGKSDTQWRPMYPQLIYARALEWNGAGSFSTSGVTTYKEFVSPFELGSAACPPPARKLGEMSSDELDAYLSTLQPAGSTYHDIGMIWGGRLISPTGLFAAENGDVPGSSPTNRHLIFLTDGETAPSDLSYSSYGLEPLDRRRWEPKSPLSLTQTVEKRFAFVCDEVKRRNVTVWVVGFGTSLSDIMKECAGQGRYFEAADAAELNAAFGTIAKRMSNLRIQR